MSLGPVLVDVLKRYGLQGLTKWASDKIITGASEAEIQLELYDQPAFKQRFWMIFARQKAGLPPVSPNDVLSYEQTATDLAHAFGITLSSHKVGDLIANNVSATELQERVSLASQAVHMASADLKGQLQRLYGITAGDLTDYWLDPKQKAPELTRRFTAAQIAEQAHRSTWGDLSAAQAEGLARQGMDAASATRGFGTLTEMADLFEAVDDTEADISKESQLRLITGDEGVAKEIEKRAGRRVAQFQGGGGYATGKLGVSGLGSANRP